MELDGAPWRTVPLAAAVEARLAIGVELDRPRARALGRALRRHRGEQIALRALARREETRATLVARLARAGVRPDIRDEVVARADEAGLVDDARYAAARSRTLVERGGGDALVLDDLRRRGVPEAVARAAVTGLEPEAERVARIVAEQGASGRTLRRLSARGFSEESLESLVAEIETGTLR